MQASLTAGSALLWGAVAASSLIIGAGLALVRKWSDRTIGSVLAIGAGALISAVSFELSRKGFEIGGGAAVGIGLAAGAITYGGLNELLQRRSPGTPTGGGGSALALGALLDGVPEQVVLGIGLAAGEGVGVSLLAAIFVSNLPEGIASAAEMLDEGRSRVRVITVWSVIAAICVLATLVGFLVADAVSPEQRAFVNGFAAGALLVMLIDEMIPDATRKAGRRAGLLTVVGFAIAAALSVSG